MEKITLTNDFHNTEVTLNVKNGIITVGQVKRARRVLCGISGCTCGDDLGARGKQEHAYEICQNARTGEIYAELAD